MKTCSKCKEEKELTEFCKDKFKKSGLKSSCKKCNNLYYIKHKDKNKEYAKQYSQINKEKIKIQKKEYRIKNRDKISNKKKEYRQINKDRINNRERIKINTNKLYRLRRNIKSLIGNSFRRNQLNKYARTTEILGCSIDHFKKHIESNFLKGMSWDNRSEWHLDHIIPVSTAKNEEDLIRLNHYTNFRPLWAKENMQKYNKIITIQLTLI
jgi:hypothetical protein